MKRAAIIGALLASLAGAGALFAAIKSDASNSPVTGGTAAQQAVVAADLAKLAAPGLSLVQIGPSAPDNATTFAPSSPNSWMTIHSTASGLPGAVASTWYASLLAEAVADDALGAAATAPVGATSAVSGPSGQSLDAAGWFLARPDNPSMAAIPGDMTSAKSAIENRLAANAAAAGVTIKSVSYVNVPRLAAVITVVTPHAAAFAADVGGRLGTLLGDDSGYDGRLVRVEDAAGNLVAVAAYTFDHIQSGSIWVDLRYGQYYGRGAPQSQ